MRDFPYMHLDKTGLAQSKSIKRVCRFIPGFRYVPWLVLWFIALSIISNVILPSQRNTAYAKQNDNNRWDNVTAWKGTVSITITYQGSDIYGEKTVQNSVSGSVNNFRGVVFEGTGYWQGNIIGSYSIYEKYVAYSVHDCDGDDKITDDEIVTITGDGSIPNDLLISLYIYEQNGVYDLSIVTLVGLDAEQTIEGCTTSSSGMLVKVDNTSFYDIPLPESVLTLSGNKKYSEDYSSNGSFCCGTVVYADYEVTWNLEPVTDATPTPTPKPTPTPIPSPEKDSCIKGGCTIAVQNQSLGETVDIVGTPFSLNYQSDRVPGRSGANDLAISHAKSLGGWSLDVHHSYDPDGGGLFLGDGTHRSADDLGSVFQVNSELTGFSIGEYIIAAEDGDEVYVFDSSGKHLRTLDALTKALRYQFTYDSDDLLATITDGYDNVTPIERDTSGNPTAIVGPYGQRTTLTMNTNGYIGKITNPANESVQLKYTSDGLLTGKTDPNGNKHNFSYDDNGRLLRDSDPAGGLKTLSRKDAEDGYTVTLETAMGKESTYQVENLTTGEQRRINTFPPGLQNIVLIGTDSSETSVIFNGVASKREYEPDPRWEMMSPIVNTASITMPSGLAGTITTSREATLTDLSNPFSLNTFTETVSINDRIYTSVYNATSTTFTNTTPEGRQTIIKTDSLGRPVQMQVAEFLPTNFVYDSPGRLESATWGSGDDIRTTTFSYNNDGYLASITDPLGNTENFEYDNAGRMIKHTLPDAREINFTYDTNGNITTITPPGRSAHAFTYTPVDLQSTYTPPKVGKKPTKTLYKYNTDRQLTSIKRPDGKVVKLGYDSAGRLSTVSKANLSYDYAATTGNLKTITRDGSNLSYSFDGTLLTDETWDGDITGSVGRTFDNNFHITSNSVNGANTINFQYDDDDLLIQAGDLILSRNTQNGLLTGSTFGSVTDSWGYNDFEEPVNYSAFYNGTTYYSVQLTRDKLGRIIAKIETIGGITDNYSYTYDLSGRLTEVQKNGTTIASYTYDSNGNRLTYTDSDDTTNGRYDGQDRLMQYSNTKYTYTANGELQKKTSAGQTTRYKYDVFGNIAAVTLSDRTKIIYQLDGQDRRIGKQVNGTLVQGFLYQDILKPVAELDGSNSLVSRFVYASRNNVPDYIIKGSNTYRIISDHLGSPRLVVNTATGQIAQRMDYDAFGNVLQDTNPGFQPFGFAGGLYDRDTRLMHFGARDYDAETGRWIAKDPISFAGGDTNLYAYVANDPVNFVDPNGKGLLEFIAKILTDFGINVGSDVAQGKKIDPAQAALEAVVPCGDAVGIATNEEYVKDIYQGDIGSVVTTGTGRNGKRAEALLTQPRD